MIQWNSQVFHLEADKNDTNLSILKRSRETDGTYENNLIVPKVSVYSDKD